MTKKIFAWTFAALLAVVLVPAGAARADSTDAEFTSYLQEHGIHLGTPSETVNMARTMCKDLEDGFTQKEELDLLAESEKLSESQAEIFIGAATADYCPGKHAPTRPPAGG